MASASCRPKHTPASTWSTGPAVSALQKGLKAFDGPNTPTDPGQIDGNFGQRTETAVRAYQTRQSITVDGVVGDQTWWVPQVQLEPRWQN